ncbi:hypothetical protein WMY93_016066 [Mugilogobius chulae]|uniref:Uncharacterized protein n=1 Tax=Mugilogobius chulae TaxID=88201 RepID=A0AAW0P1Z3_9GOBI
MSLHSPAGTLRSATCAVVEHQQQEEPYVPHELMLMKLWMALALFIVMQECVRLSAHVRDQGTCYPDRAAGAPLTHSLLLLPGSAALCSVALIVITGAAVPSGVHCQLCQPQQDSDTAL